MNNPIDPSPFEENSLKIIESLIDMHDDLVFVYYKNQPILFNAAGKKFFGVDTLKNYTRAFGVLENGFVPHPSYFHASKVPEGQTWQEALMELKKADRIVSMVDQELKSHAFSVSIESPLDGYELIFFKDITSDLIKRIMTENNTNLDSDSDAYNRQYFEYITSIIETAATFNEKYIATCSIDFDSSEAGIAKTISESINGVIRDDDILVRWSQKSFLLVFLIVSKEHAEPVGRKISESVEKFQTQQNIRVCVSVQRAEEDIQTIARRCENLLEGSKEHFLTV